MKLLFKDTFTGLDNALPHRGRWMTFLSPAGSTFATKLMEILNNQLHLKAIGTADGRKVNVMTKAEYRIPFTVKFDFEIKDGGFAIELDTADIEDGMIVDTSFYGKYLFRVEAFESDGGHTQCYKLTRVKDGSEQAAVYSGDNAWATDTSYTFELQITELNLSTGYYQAVVTIKEGAVTRWTTTQEFDRSRSESLRVRFFCQTTDREAYFDNFKVYGNKRNRIGKRATIKLGPGYQPYANPSDTKASSNESGLLLDNSNEGSYSDRLSSADNQRLGHRITITDKIVVKAKFWLKRYGSPTGTLTCVIRKSSDSSILATSLTQLMLVQFPLPHIRGMNLHLI
ncbi:MAG: hypothetical protein H3Z50_00190 [archaeon]|nr:hypothetical protein [archaeon]MCP8305887.1 hypothetical protein [archaeon]